MVELIVANWMIIVTGVLIPVGTGLLTRLDSRPVARALVTFVLSLLAGAVEAVVVNGCGANDFECIVAYVLAIWTTAHLAYKMAYKPAGNGVNPVTKATPEIGVA